MQRLSFSSLAGELVSAKITWITIYSLIYDQMLLSVNQKQGSEKTSAFPLSSNTEILHFLLCLIFVPMSRHLCLCRQFSPFPVLSQSFPSPPAADAAKPSPRTAHMSQ